MPATFSTTLVAVGSICYYYYTTRFPLKFYCGMS